MYLTKRDFESHGCTDGCAGCRDLASGRQGPVIGLAPHTTAFRRRMEAAIEASDPARWERHLARRVAEGPSESPTTSLGPEASAPDRLVTESVGRATLQRTEASDEVEERKPGRRKEAKQELRERQLNLAIDLIARICAVDMCEVYSPPRVGREASKSGLTVGEAMDITTGWDSKKDEDRQRAEIRGRGGAVGPHRKSTVCGIQLATDADPGHR